MSFEEKTAVDELSLSETPLHNELRYIVKYLGASLVEIEKLNHRSRVARVFSVD